MHNSLSPDHLSAIGPSQIRVLLDMGKGHHPDLMCQVVKNNKFAGNGKNGLWEGRGFRRSPLAVVPTS